MSCVTKSRKPVAVVWFLKVGGIANSGSAKSIFREKNKPGTK